MTYKSTQALTEQHNPRIKLDGDSPEPNCDNVQEQIKLVNVSIEMVTLVIKKVPRFPVDKIDFEGLYNIWKEHGTPAITDDNIEGQALMENTFLMSDMTRT